LKNKEHISVWVKHSNLKEAEMCMKSLECKSRSDYIDAAIEFYNGYLHDKNNEAYANKTIINILQGMMDSFERRMARQMFKQAVEVAKVFWLVVRGLGLNPEDVDDLHSDCVEEVKSIEWQRLLPENKDWNEDLVELREQEQEQNFEMML